MSASSFTPKDVKAAKAKYPNEPLLKLEISKARKNKNAQQPTYYVPISMKNAAGKYNSVNLKFVKQVACSSAKIPFGVTEEEAKDVRIAYRRITNADLESTDYEEEKKDSLIEANNEFLDALDIIADEYLALVDKEVLTYKGDKFKIGKNKTVNCFRQSHRKAQDGEDGDDDNMIALADPIYRVKLGADFETRKIGVTTDKGHRYIVFDYKKSIMEAAKGNKKPVVAKISSGGQILDLTIENVKHFITYMSLTGGSIYFDSVCISRSGVSLMCKFTELHVLRHKTMKNAGLNTDDLTEMSGFGTNNAEDEDINLDEPEDETKEGPKDKQSSKGASKASNTKNNKSLSKAIVDDGDDELVIDDEPAETDVVEDADDTPVEPKVVKIAVKPADKPTPKPVIKPADKSVTKLADKPATKPSTPEQAEVDDEPAEVDAEVDDEPAEVDAEVDDEPVDNVDDDEPVDESNVDDVDDESPKATPKPKAKPVVKTAANLKAGPRKK